MRVAGPTLRQPSAFTLMELMVVIALMAILSAAIVPEMRGSFEDAVLRASARQMIDLCNVANSRAVALGQIHRIRYDRSSRHLIVETHPQRESRSATFRPVRDLQGSSARLDPRINLSIRTGISSPGSVEPFSGPVPDADTITFYPDGTADPAEMDLSDRGGGRLGLKLNPVTARIQKLGRPRG